MNRTEYAAQRVAELRHEGFDRTRQFTDDYFIACSHCWILWEKGKPVHYPDCPNQRYFCRECNGIVPQGVSLCGTCVLELL